MMINGREHTFLKEKKKKESLFPVVLMDVKECVLQTTAASIHLWRELSPLEAGAPPTGRGD